MIVGDSRKHDIDVPIPQPALRKGCVKKKIDTIGGDLPENNDIANYNARLSATAPKF